MKRGWKDNVFGWIILLPALAVLALLFVNPLINLLTTSLTNRNLLRPDRNDFIGLGNYISMLRNPEFWSALKKSVVFTGWVTVLSVIISMVVAVLMNMEFPLKRVLFALILLPWVTSFMSSAFVFTLIFDYSYGVLNYIVSNVLHLMGRQNWLGQMDMAMPAVIVVSTWHFLPFSILVLSNALKQVSEEVIESAVMDGANGLQVFFLIKLPLMKASLTTLIIVRLAAAFKTFDSIFLLTKGGPSEATTTLPLWYYSMGFQAFRSGMGSAIGITLIIVVLIAYFILIGLFGEDAV